MEECKTMKYRECDLKEGIAKELISKWEVECISQKGYCYEVNFKRKIQEEK